MLPTPAHRYDDAERQLIDGDRKAWDAPLDKSHESNLVGDKKNIEKTYNTYHPRDGAEK